ncbi:MAG: hypothetical protein CSA81_09940 [Acidobacteria bacterium]|nr:MAG: hypothetical protein CSA81_09940 [Acidobacteriota bacterium]
MGSRSTIDWRLYDLVRKGTIRRVLRGIYDYHKMKEMFYEEIPEFNKIPAALRAFEKEINSTAIGQQLLILIQTCQVQQEKSNRNV